MSDNMSLSTKLQGYRNLKNIIKLIVTIISDMYHILYHICITYFLSDILKLNMFVSN